jgi:predicted GH43/DUF377 family glycosyl hydrolase
MRHPAAGACLAVCLLSASCGGYRDFSLPVQRAAAPAGVQIKWSVLPEPVLPSGARGEWDGVDALNPSVLYTPAGYFNFYSGFDGRTWHTGLAISHDGLAWIKRGRVMSPDPATWEGGYIAANGSVIDIDGEFWHWYQAGRTPQIGLARSKDGVRWAKEPAPVLRPGPRGSWDERGVADPYVVRFENMLYMYYLGQDRARRQRLGVAMSQDGVRWLKLRSNPILELGEPGAFDDTGLGEPAVWSSAGSYWMLYTARDKQENRRLGLARSQNGVSWQRVSERPVLSGAKPWNAKVVCDPSVALKGSEVQVWFGGGDRAEPAENLNGQIGFATLQLTAGTLAK